MLSTSVQTIHTIPTGRVRRRSNIYVRTRDVVAHQNFKTACIVRGLLDSDEQWEHSLTEVGSWQGGFQLRQLFICILLNCYPADTLQLWIDHAQYLSDKIIERGNLSRNSP